MFSVSQIKSGKELAIKEHGKAASGQREALVEEMPHMDLILRQVWDQQG